MEGYLSLRILMNKITIEDHHEISYIHYILYIIAK